MKRPRGKITMIYRLVFTEDKIVKALPKTYYACAVLDLKGRSTPTNIQKF
jgi:hypothetical protein